jgi:hypothetical protein
MEKDKEITSVIFRKFKKGSDIIALFPEVQYNTNKDLCTSYMHIGQHGAASYHLIGNTVAAQEDEYLPLYNELTSLGYNLKIQKKISKKWFEL